MAFDRRLEIRASGATREQVADEARADLALTPLRTPEQLLPSTFEERGAAIPFTTPMFAYARVRKDYRDRLELMVTRFAAVAGVYVVPWPMVPDIAALTTHDVMLYEEVSAKKVLNPYDMRLAALGVAKTGLAGPKAAEAATLARGACADAGGAPARVSASKAARRWLRGTLGISA